MTSKDYMIALRRAMKETPVYEYSGPYDWYVVQAHVQIVYESWQLGNKALAYRAKGAHKTLIGHGFWFQPRFRPVLDTLKALVDYYECYPGLLGP